MRRPLAVLAVLVFITSAPAQTVGHTTGRFHGCKPEGTGGDGYLNQLKNRDIPPDTYDDMTLANVIAEKPAHAMAMEKRDRDTWEEDARAEIAPWEAKGARVIGRLIALRTQGPEACNCKSTRYADIHLWIATKASASAKPTQSMVIEISPRDADDHPGWNKDDLIALAKKGTRVRISGWLTWDDEHGSEVGKSRGTLWELHPVHLIETYQNGVWKDFDEE
jgi:hypothetical protein